MPWTSAPGNHDYGGNGWLRLLQILPDGKTVRCQDYSPLIDQRCIMSDRTFDFELAMPGA